MPSTPILAASVRAALPRDGGVAPGDLAGAIESVPLGGTEDLVAAPDTFPPAER